MKQLSLFSDQHFAEPAPQLTKRTYSIEALNHLSDHALDIVKSQLETDKNGQYKITHMQIDIFEHGVIVSIYNDSKSAIPFLLGFGMIGMYIYNAWSNQHYHGDAAFSEFKYPNPDEPRGKCITSAEFAIQRQSSRIFPNVMPLDDLKREVMP